MGRAQRERDPFDLRMPRYTWAYLVVGLAVAGFALTFLAYIWPDPHMQRRIVAGAIVAVLAFVVVHLWFVRGVLCCSWKRVRSYGGLLETKGDIENQLARERAKHALHVGVPILKIEGFYSSKGAIMVVLDTAVSSDLSPGDRLQILDTLEQKLLGAARVISGGGGRVEAEMVEADALFEGFVRQQLEGPEHTIPSVAALSEKDMSAICGAMPEPREEEAI